MKIEARITLLRSTFNRPISVKALMIDVRGYSYVGERPRHDMYLAYLPLEIYKQGFSGLEPWMVNLVSDLIDVNHGDIGIAVDFRAVTDIKILGHFPPGVENELATRKRDQVAAKAEETVPLDSVKDMLMGLSKRKAGPEPMVMDEVRDIPTPEHKHGPYCEQCGDCLACDVPHKCHLYPDAPVEEAQPADRRIAEVFCFNNGMVAVCDQYGKQWCEYQGKREEVEAKIKEAIKTNGWTVNWRG